MERNVERAGMLLRRSGAGEKEAEKDHSEQVCPCCARCPSISDTVQTSVPNFHTLVVL